MPFSQLDIDKNIADQCIQGEGLVQINCQIYPRAHKINIVDILKPSDDVLEATTVQPRSTQKRSHDGQPINNTTTTTVTPSPKNSNKNWAIDNAFKRDQTRLKIPDNPVEWTRPQVRFWLEWARKQFHQASIQPEDWAQMTGEELCRLTVQEFNRMVPQDPGNFFWTHLELLRKCKYVAVQQKGGGPPPMALLNSSSRRVKVAKLVEEKEKVEKVVQQPKSSPQKNTSSSAYALDDSGDFLVMRVEGGKGAVEGTRPVNRSGTNGQTQLWQFLLEILTDVQHRDIIQWVGVEGEFKLMDAEQVAQLWGRRKNKPNMNYEKLSRALRYYYDGDMLAKIPGKRFVYKFICDLQKLVGYTAGELARLVEEM